MSDDATVWRRIPIEIFNEGKLDMIDEFFAEDYVEHIPTPPNVPPGREGLRMFVGAIRQAFPNLQYEVLQQFQDGDMHIGYVRATGTMTGDFMEMPASNKSATWDEVHIGRFANGKVAEHWGIVDQLTMLQQLGFAPLPTGAGG